MSTTTPEVTTPPAAPAQGDGPWAIELTTRFTDPDQRAAVDAFLREKVQPYITQVEQKASASPKPNEQAEQLYKDLNESPMETFLAITAELFDEDAARVVVDALSNAGTPEPTTPPAETPTTPTPQQVAAMDPEDREAINWSKQQRDKALYDAQVARVQAAHPDLKLTGQLLSPFVAVNEGDFDAAVESYKQFTSELGVTAPAPADPPAPPTLGGETTTPPVQPKKQTFDEALADFAADMRAASATNPNV